MTKEQKELMDEMEEYCFLARENPCGMTPEQFHNISLTLHSVKEMMDIFNYENTSRFLNVNPRTLRRMVESGKVEKPHRHGNISLSFSVGAIMRLFRRKNDIKE